MNHEPRKTRGTVIGLDQTAPLTHLDAVLAHVAERRWRAGVFHLATQIAAYFIGMSASGT